jgi:broad specificity phosphatase PhoE
VIVAVRHALVANPAGIVYGRLPGFHLAPEGRAEAEFLAQTLQLAPLCAVHASPLDRAVETAEILAAPHGLRVATDDRLLEWSFWVRWQGVAWAEIRGRDPDALSAYAERPDEANPGDTLGDVAGRVLEWAENADEAHPEGLVLGVTHEAPLKAALLSGRRDGMAGYHGRDLPHLATVRLVPRPPELVDLQAWAASC